MINRKEAILCGLCSIQVLGILGGNPSPVLEEIVAGTVVA